MWFHLSLRTNRLLRTEERRVGRVTPCATSSADSLRGGPRVTRPTNHWLSSTIRVQLRYYVEKFHKAGKMFALLFPRPFGERIKVRGNAKTEISHQNILTLPLILTFSPEGRRDSLLH